jgi:hypothetical protein
MKIWLDAELSASTASWLRETLGHLADVRQYIERAVAHPACRMLAEGRGSSRGG